MTLKERGISAKVAPDFYRMMERMRIQLKNHHGIKVRSHTQLTKLISKNNNLMNQKWINQIKKGVI